MRRLATPTLVALALVPAFSGVASAQTSGLPDSLWRAYTPPAGHGTAVGDAEDSGFPFLGLASLLVGGALLVGLRMSLRTASREPLASLPAPAPAPVRRAPVALLEPATPDPVPVVPPSPEGPLEVTRLIPAEPEPAPQPEETLAQAASRRHRELYEAVYQRQLDRIDRRRRNIRRHVDRRGTDAP